MTSQSKPAKFHIKPVRLQARESAIVASEADVALATGHYREATELYKELVKRERRPAWIEALALCYAARANELAVKHMFKEALVLWRNRAQSCGKPLAERVYFDWLARAGEQAEMVRVLQTGGLAAAALAELEMRLAPSSSESRGQEDLGSVPPLQYQRAGVPPIAIRPRLWKPVRSLCRNGRTDLGLCVLDSGASGASICSRSGTVALR